jgi:hypothetical protein
MRKGVGVFWLVGCWVLICLTAGCGGAESSAAQAAAEEELLVSANEERPDGPFAVYYDSCCYKLSWSQLALVEYEERVVPEAELGVLLYPLFSDSLRLLDGCLVELGGYALPLEETGLDTVLILSAFPYTQCFFCGNAGPESVAEVVWRRERDERLPMDERIRVRGRLYLNDQDPDHMQYQLKEAELLEK